MTIQMRIVDFDDEILQASIYEKIKDCRSNMYESHNPIYNDNLEVKFKVNIYFAELVISGEAIKSIRYDYSMLLVATVVNLIN
jgi:hypothetical protein